MDEVPEDWKGASQCWIAKGETMTLEIRDLSNSCQCSREDGSFNQLSSIVIPACLELASFSQFLGPTKPRDGHLVADWSYSGTTQHGSDLLSRTNGVSLDVTNFSISDSSSKKRKYNNSTYLRDGRIK